MTSPAEDLSTLLVSDGIATAGTDLFVDQMPEESQHVPHKCIALVNAGGLDPNPRYNRDLPVIQVLIRGDLNKQAEAYDLAYSVKDSLLGRASVTINNSLYSCFVLQGNINSLGVDDRGRSRYSFRVRVTRDNFTGSSRDDL